MTAPPNPLADGIASLMTSLANQGLSLDARSRGRLRALDGLVLELTGAAPLPTLFVTVTGDRLEVLARAPAPPVVRVSGPPWALLDLLRGAPPEGLSIDGDGAVLAQFAELLADFEPDLAAPAARLLGERTASDLVGAVELAASGLRSLLQGISASLAAGAQTQFTARDQAEPLMTGIDDLQLRLDRLQARIEQIEQKP